MVEQSQHVEYRTSLLNLRGHPGGNGSDAGFAIIGLQPRAEIIGRMWCFLNEELNDRICECVDFDSMGKQKWWTSLEWKEVEK